jgi:nucleotide-binding universal stress UspA family protein
MPAIPLLGIATQIFIAFYLIRYSPKAFITAVVWIGVGAVIYYSYASKKEAKHAVFREAIQRLVRKDYRILVPLGMQENVGPLMSVALAVARHFDGEIVALSVIEVPFQTPLTSGTVMPDMQERRNNLRLAEHLSGEESIPCRRVIKVAHRLSQAILDTAREERCNFIIVGRSARPRFGSRVVRSFMDRVLMESPCHVAVVKCSDVSSVDRILVPVDDDRNSRLALELLPAFMSRWNAGTEITALTLDGSQVKARAEQLLQRLSRELPFPAGATTSYVEGIMPTKEILERIRPADLVVMGESQWTGLAHLFGSTLPDEIAERTDRPVVFVKAYAPKRRRSLVYRLLTGA